LNSYLYSVKSALARGLGKSYGDAAVNPLGLTVLMERLNRILSFDNKQGVVQCEAGVTIADLIHTFLPQGWFPLVVPGTQDVTVGGAIASDIHGKNHHREGSFSQAVKGFSMLLANGDTVNCSREDNADLFWATIGGMGLTGFILDVELSLQKVSSAYINSCLLKGRDLEHTLRLFDQLEPKYQYSVAWLDCLAPAKELGRSILFFGNHAELKDLSTNEKASPFPTFSDGQLSVPFDMPSGLLNKTSISLFNQLYWSVHQQNENNRIIDCMKFFFPLDKLGSWNRFYGRKGFTQYQCVVNLAHGQEILTKILTLSAKHGMSSFLTVLKRFGPETGILSFPKAGYTLTLDLPISEGLLSFINSLNDLVIAGEGRVYLAKDAYLSPDYFKTMYPNYKKWQAIKSKFDPNQIFSSALSNRIGLTTI
jgi:FAD/FMN-containing dehydrogenase